MVYVAPEEREAASVTNLQDHRVLVVEWVVRDDDLGAVTVNASQADSAALQALPVRDCTNGKWLPQGQAMLETAGDRGQGLQVGRLNLAPGPSVAASSRIGGVKLDQPATALRALNHSLPLAITAVITAVIHHRRDIPCEFRLPPPFHRLSEEHHCGRSPWESCRRPRPEN